MLRSGTNEQDCNGVGIVGLLSKELKKDLISVSGNCDPVMSIELGLEEMVVNIMCACSPRMGCIGNEKETCWEHLRQELSATQYDESVIIGGYLN